MGLLASKKSHNTKSEASIKKYDYIVPNRLSTYHTASFAANDVQSVDEK